jgi:hypothetical protein
MMTMMMMMMAGRERNSSTLLFSKLNLVRNYKCSREMSVGIAMGYGLKDQRL